MLYFQFLNFAKASWFYFNEGISFAHGLLKFTETKDLLNEYLRDLAQKFYERTGMHGASTTELRNMK